MSIVHYCPLQSHVGGDAPLFIYGPLRNGDFIAPIEISRMSDTTIHAYGVFGGGGRIRFYGSNNPDDLNKEPGTPSSSWATISDGQGNVMEKSETSLEIVQEKPIHLLSGKVTGGDDSTEIYVAMKCKRRF